MCFIPTVAVAVAAVVPATRDVSLAGVGVRRERRHAVDAVIAVHTWG